MSTTLKLEEKRVQEWNAKARIGAPVRCYEVTEAGERKQLCVTRTAGRAFLAPMTDGPPVAKVKVEDLPSAWPLSLIEGVGEERHGAAPRAGEHQAKFMEGLEPIEQARRALEELLKWAHEDSGLGKRLHGTSTYFLHSEALAAITGEDLAALRWRFAPKVE